MKKSNGLFAVILCTAIVLAGCSSLNRTAKGAMIGGGGGAAVGAGLGAIFGKSGKSAAIGAAIGGAVGATTGAIIGKKMDKAAAEASRIEGVRVDSIRDANNLKAVKVSFDSGILFATGKSTLTSTSKTALTKFAKILEKNPTMDIAVMGHTDNTGSLEINEKLSLNRAQSVVDYLKSQNITSSQFKEISGKDWSMPVAENKTAAGRKLNRRVEVYMYASEKMIEEAETAN